MTPEFTGARQRVSIEPWSLPETSTARRSAAADSTKDLEVRHAMD